MTRASNKINIQPMQIVWLAVVLVGLYVIVPQLGDFKTSLQTLTHALLAWTSLAVGFTLATYMAGAFTYLCLSQKSMTYHRILLVQLAAMFVNRLLPAGVGALGVNFVYLRKLRHSPAQATAIVATNNLLGTVGHVCLLVGVGITLGVDSLPLQGSDYKAVYILPLLLIALVVYFAWRISARVRSYLDGVAAQLMTYRKRPVRLLLALLSSVALTLCNVLCLYASMQALGVSLGFVTVLLVFSFGVGAGTITPTPGGLGGFEAGLVAGFVAYHVNPAVALAIALLYRLVSYWLMLLIGAAAFVRARRLQLL